MTKKAIVTGMIGTYPVGGVAWDYGQYALGLEQLGWEVYYLEDTGGESYDPAKRDYGKDSSAGVRFLQQSLQQLSPTLGQRWHYRSADGTGYGMEVARIKSLFSEADLFLNVSGGTLLRDEYLACPCKVLIETDPGWNHFVNFPKWDAEPGWQGTHGYRAHDLFFSYAERIGRPDCLLPDLGIRWSPTRPPVVLDMWKSRPPAQTWTTVMTWNNFRKPVEYLGRQYGTKEMEFPKVENLPGKTNARFELAVGGSDAPISHWQGLGWHVVDSHSVSGTLEEYRNYIECSRGEFSVAKNLYTATRSGWFSCRTVCYLAAGKPAVVQDTGFSDIIPTGWGLLKFNDVDEAASAVRTVETDYQRHCEAALDLARSHFDARVVLGELLHQIGLK